MWTEYSATLIIAHRGDSAHAPENTLAAFQMALRNDADAIEFDVKLSADGHVIVMHDQTVDRTTNGQGDVRYLSLAALKELDVGKSFSGDFSGEQIPTLNDVFETIGSHILMNIELTNYRTPGDDLVPKVVNLIKKHNIAKQVLFSSFYLRNLKKAQSLLPNVPCGLLAMPGIPGAPARLWGWRGNVVALHPYLSSVNNNMVSRLHSSGKRVNVWTVNDGREMDRLLSLGVDGIFTDDPALLAKRMGRVS